MANSWKHESFRKESLLEEEDESCWRLRAFFDRLPIASPLKKLFLIPQWHQRYQSITREKHSLQKKTGKQQKIDINMSNDDYTTRTRTKSE
jgi:hypothetical protein